MPRHSILSAVKRDSLLVLPDEKDEPIQHYTLWSEVQWNSKSSYPSR